MKPINFPESNKQWAKDQPEYQTLPAYINDEETISCWHLEFKERLILLFTGRLWLRQLNFNQALQPQLPQIENPFKVGE